MSHDACTVASPFLSICRAWGYQAEWVEIRGAAQQIAGGDGGVVLEARQARQVRVLCEENDSRGEVFWVLQVGGAVSRIWHNKESEVSQIHGDSGPTSDPVITPWFRLMA